VPARQFIGARQLGEKLTDFLLIALRLDERQHDAHRLLGALGIQTGLRHNSGNQLLHGNSGKFELASVL
jgi:hypothetical protein